ncbi:MAG: transglycosylase domain-containing protein [Spirochaetia bacterium]
MSISLGSMLGLSFSVSSLIKEQETIGNIELALPTRVYSLDGELVTEFFGDERRELVLYEEIPRQTVLALLAREDREFFNHSGFSIRGTMRALTKILLLPFGGGFVSGGSTLTQQLSGHVYANRLLDKSITRKLRELYWAWQLEKYLSKEEILETYLNKMGFGHNTYGIQAASQYFYGHNVQETNTAESALLVIQLANPSGLYSPFRRPRRAQLLQREMLDQMVYHGYIQKDQADLEYNEYWDNYNWSRDAYGTAFFDRSDKAPWFSEYVRTELASLMPGKSDIYTGGYSVFTTVNLKYQSIAEEELETGLEAANENLQRNYRARYNRNTMTNLPYIDMIALLFNLEGFRLPQGQVARFSKEAYDGGLNATLDIVSSMFGLNNANRASQIAYSDLLKRQRKSQVQTAMITLEQSTGYVLAMVGGNRFDRFNQLNRAMNAKIMPGSAIKPLYFVEAISSGRLTAASNLANYPRYWVNEDESVYTPLNYDGNYDTRGVLMRRALAMSLNIPAITVLEEIGIDAAIARMSQLMNITDPMEISRTFPRVWALGLGVMGISPVQMARAFAVFPNQGKSVEPITVRYVTDRYGRIVIDFENDIKLKQAKTDQALMTPQTAYIMVDMLKSTVDNGTLWGAFVRHGGGFYQGFAGKTGTSQNWADAWAIGFTPYYTTTMWLGFDQGGYSLGPENEASSSIARTLVRYMKRIHEGLPLRNFPRPDTGIVSVNVDAVTGLLPSSYTTSSVLELFLTGTVPTYYSDGTVENSVSRALSEALRQARGSSALYQDSAVDGEMINIPNQPSGPSEDTGLIDLGFGAGTASVDEDTGLSPIFQLPLDEGADSNQADPRVAENLLGA